MNNNPNQIIQVDPKPIEPIKVDPNKSGGIRIGKVGTLNLIVEPFKKRYHKHYKNDKMHLIVDLVLGAIILVLLGVMLNLWIFSRSQKNSMEFKVSSSPVNLINGQETKFTINYANIGKDELGNVNLVLKLPDSLRNPQFNSANFDAKTNTLNIGALAPKASGQLEVKGLLLGNFTDKQEIIAAINYENKYGQARQESFSQSFSLADSVLKTEVKLPEKVIANAIFTAGLNINNTSNLAFDEVKVKISGSDNFSVRQINLDKVGTDTYLIGKLTANQKYAQDFSAKIAGIKETGAKITIEVIARQNNEEFVLNKIENSVTAGISRLDLGFLNLENNRSIAPGGTTTYTLHYKNNEAYALQNVELGLDLAGDFADANYLAKNYKQVKGTIVIFNQNDYPELAKINPGQEGSIQVKVAARSEIAYAQYLESGYKLEATVLASYDDPSLKTRITLESDPIFTQIDSNLILKTTALFYTALGDQIGVGSVPPKVGEYTSYWAIIKVNNTNNKIKDLKITAKVPAGIEFTNVYNVTDGDQINFDETSRTLEWKLPEVTAFAGFFNPAPEARIQLAITPTADQVGKSPLLLTDIKALATDEVTNAFLSATGSNVSIAIFSDSKQNKVIQ